MKTVSSRPYRMGARGEAAARTGDRILDAAADVFWERPSDQLSLDEVALRADVSVRTVIRRFGSKEGLFSAAAARQLRRTDNQRSEAPIGDTATAVAVLVEHYELMGDRVLRLLVAEQNVPGLRDIAERGRDLHRDWCARVFGPALADLTPVDRRRRSAQIVAICDVYTWKLLRRDACLSRRQTELALVELLNALMKES